MSFIWRGVAAQIAQRSNAQEKYDTDFQIRHRPADRPLLRDRPRRRAELWVRSNSWTPMASPGQIAGFSRVSDPETIPCDAGENGSASDAVGIAARVFNTFPRLPADSLRCHNQRPLAQARPNSGERPQLREMKPNCKALAMTFAV